MFLVNANPPDAMLSCWRSAARKWEGNIFQDSSSTITKVGDHIIMSSLLQTSIVAAMTGIMTAVAAHYGPEQSRIQTQVLDHLFAGKLTHSLPSWRKMIDYIVILLCFFFVLDHSAAVMAAVVLTVVAAVVAVMAAAVIEPPAASARGDMICNFSSSFKSIY